MLFFQDRLAVWGLGPKRLEEQGGLPGVLLAFLLGLAVSGALFLPFLIIDKGFFTYCGDFNSQQIPFYYYLQQFLKTGGGTWSWATDLGSSVVNSYSFYNLGSPFLWLTLLFPSSWVPFMMVPLLMLKFGCIAAAACLWLSRYAKSRNLMVICSLIYAFCGFNVYNVFFNHMLEPVIFFPLMLWALDGFVHEKRRGWFALFVGLALLNSYFFFIGNVVFILLYFIVKVACGEYRISLKEFSLLALEVLIGVGIGMVLALPAFYNLVGNPRTDNFANGFGLIMYGRVQQYFAILSSMFLPPDPPYLPNIFTDATIKWTSMSAFLPIAGMGGVIAYCRSRRGGSVKALLYISLVMALVPILNSSFYAFNASYYARWYYMPLLIMVLATLRSLEDADINLVSGSRISLILTSVFVVFGILPVKDEEGVWSFGLTQDSRMFWLTWVTAMFAALLFYVLVRYRRHRVRFAPMLLASVMGFSAFYAVIHISLGKFPQWERDANYREEQYEGGALLAAELPNDEFYRIDVYYSSDAYDNLGLWAGKSNLYCFNSVVTTSIMEFYPMVGVKRDVSSKPEAKYYALRGLLGAKYTIMRANDEQNFLLSEGSAGWVYYKNIGPFTVYENENFLPLGFTYSQYLPMEGLEQVRTDDRALLLTRAIGLDEEQITDYAHMFEQSALVWRQTQDTNKDAEEGTKPETARGWYSYNAMDYSSYQQEVARRRNSAAYQSSHDASGFSCRILLSSENLVFFSVPYDPGFTATVNGKPAEVLKVSGGMMAVHAPAGDNSIVFTYHTPGFNAGGIITLICLGLLALYLLACRYAGARQGKKRAALAAATQAALPGGEGENDAAEIQGNPQDTAETEE